MNTCKTCKWWEKAKWRQDCKCTNQKLGTLDDDGIDVEGCEGGWDYMTTGPDFGCIHWEEKE